MDEELKQANEESHTDCDELVHLQARTIKQLQDKQDFIRRKVKVLWAVEVLEIYEPMLLSGYQDEWHKFKLKELDNLLAAIGGLSWGK